MLVFRLIGLLLLKFLDITLICSIDLEGILHFPITIIIRILYFNLYIIYSKKILLNHKERATHQRIPTIISAFLSDSFRVIHSKNNHESFAELDMRITTPRSLL